MDEKDMVKEDVLSHRVVKKKSARTVYRVVGLVFVFLGGLIISAGLIKDKPNIILMAIGLAAVCYGVTLVKGSFRFGAYTSDFIFEDEHLVVHQEKKDIVIEYDDMENLNLVIPNPDSAYYIIKFDAGRRGFVLPFAGKRDKCDLIYSFLLEKTGITAQVTQEGKDDEE